MKNSLYLHLRAQIDEADFVSQLDLIIETAYFEYLKDNLSDMEYGKIYFAAVRKMPYSGQKKVINAQLGR